MLQLILFLNRKKNYRQLKKKHFFQLNKQIYSILNTTPHKRTYHQIQTLLRHTKQIPFFKSYNDQGNHQVHFLSAKFMRHEVFQKDDVIIKEGDIGDKFYIILDGSVGVYKDNIVYNKMTQSMQNEGLVYQNYEMISGQAFGELALLNQKPRSATIIAHSKANFATISTEEFHQILYEFEQHNNKQSFMGIFTQLPIFAHWTSTQIKDLYLTTYRLNYKQNEFVFKQGDQSEEVYIILQGIFSIAKKIKLVNDQQSQQQQQYENSKLLQKYLKQKSNEKNMNFITLTEGEFFGEEDILKNRDRTYSVICHSAEGQLLMIKKSVFQMRICADHQSMHYLQQRADEKEQLIKNISTNSFNTIKMYKNLLIDHNLDFAIQQQVINIKKHIYQDFNSTKKQRFLEQKDTMPTLQDEDIKCENLSDEKQKDNKDSKRNENANLKNKIQKNRKKQMEKYDIDSFYFNKREIKKHFETRISEPFDTLTLSQNLIQQNKQQNDNSIIDQYSRQRSQISSSLSSKPPIPTQDNPHKPSKSLSQIMLQNCSRKSNIFYKKNSSLHVIKNKINEYSNMDNPDYQENFVPYHKKPVSIDNSSSPEQLKVTQKIPQPQKSLPSIRQRKQINYNASFFNENPDKTFTKNFDFIINHQQNIQKFRNDDKSQHKIRNDQTEKSIQEQFEKQIQKLLTKDNQKRPFNRKYQRSVTHMRHKMCLDGL